MKKFAKYFAALLVVFSLTGCGSEPQLSAYEQQKLEACEEKAQKEVIRLVNMYVDDTYKVIGIPDISDMTMDEVESSVSFLYSQLTQGQASIEVDGYGFYNAVISFRKAIEEMGQLESVGKTSGRIDGQQIIVTVEVKGEKRDGSAEIIFTNDMFAKVKSAALNPTYSLGEKMGKAGLNTLIGISTVFVMLIIISFIISLFKYVYLIERAAAKLGAKLAKSKEARAAKKAAKLAAKEAKANPVGTGIDAAINQIEKNETVQTAPVAAATDDTELVAVIAAAIAAYEGTSADGFVVRSIRKLKRS